MMGVAYLLFFGVYLLVSLMVVTWTAARAKKRGRNPLLWGLGALLVMYNLVFWDWLPSIVQHDYYCRNHAGFWVYKTLDQWKQENPGIFETLVYDDESTKTIHEEGDWGFTNRYVLNDRFEWVSQFQSVTFLGVDFGLRSNQSTLVDRNTRRVLAKSVDYAVSSGAGGLRFWKSRVCNNNEKNENNFFKFKRLFQGRKP